MLRLLHFNALLLYKVERTHKSKHLIILFCTKTNTTYARRQKPEWKENNTFQYETLRKMYTDVFHVCVALMSWYKSDIFFPKNVATPPQKGNKLQTFLLKNPSYVKPNMKICKWTFQNLSNTENPFWRCTTLNFHRGLWKVFIFFFVWVLLSYMACKYTFPEI